MRRKNKVIVNNGVSVLPDVYLATVLKNLESFGYTFSEPLIQVLRTLSVDEFTSFYQQLITDIKEIMGANVEYKPMYPNFPTQVMEMSDVELYINAIIHYYSTYALKIHTGEGLPNEGLPVYDKEERIPLLDNVELKIIELATEKELDEILSRLMSAKTSVSDTDKKDIDWAISTYSDVSRILPSEIPLKENVGFVVSSLLTHEKASVNEISHYFKTATDVLRLAVSLSDGDVSLASNTKFRKFKRPERRMILGLLENCGNITEDMIRYKKRWIRLGEILHPGEFQSKFPKAKSSFDMLRKDVKVETFGTKLEHALYNKDIVTAVELLKKRPGEFARRLDFVLRLSEGVEFAFSKSYDGFSGVESYVLHSFAEVVNEVATPVLLQVATHFKYRNDENELRTFFPKGNAAKMVAVENTLTSIREEIRFFVTGIVIKSLTERLAELPSLGKVYLDEELRDYIVPFSQRSASKSSRPLVRGSQIAFPEGDTIRFFTYWKEGYVNGKHSGNVDLDLGAVIYDENWQYRNHISFTHLKSEEIKACHSGDITSAPYGACEFIDVNIPAVLEDGGRYIGMSLNVYWGPSFNQIPECFAGWMVRKHPNSGEVFEPSTVLDKVDLTVETKVAIPMILDLKERKVIWCDLGLKHRVNMHNTVETNDRGMVMIGKAMSTLVKPNLYDLFFLHANARGTFVETKEEADTVFSVKDGITPYDIETIMSDYLV